MSEKQELRMIEALGIASQKCPPRRFYRPCLSVETGEMVKEYELDVELIVWEYLAERGLI